MEKIIYCKICGSSNLLENTSQDFNGSCHHCGETLIYIAEGISEGTIVGQRYQLRDEIDKDEHSNIYFALDYSINEIVLVRIFSWEYSYSITNPEEFLHLNESISLLAQPRHVKIIDWGIENDLIYTVWPGDSAETVEKLLRIHSNFESDIAISIIKEIAECLSKAYHELGIGHYALSPKNVYLDSQGTTKVSELGFATQLFQDQNFQDSGVEFYDWRYQAPEIVLGWHGPNIQSDMFSLGYCLFTMITGEPPFTEVRPISQEDYLRIGFSKSDQYRLGETFLKLFNGLTAIKPSDRFSSWDDVISSMDYYLQEEKMIRNSALSGRRRSMPTSYNMDIISVIAKSPPIKIKTYKKRKKVMSASDIRKQSTLVTSKQSRRLNSKKKKAQSSMPVIVGIIASLAAIFMIILLVLSQDKNDAPINRTTSLKKPGPVEHRNVRIDKDIGESSQQKKLRDTLITGVENADDESITHKKTEVVNDQAFFNEMRFKVREYTIRKDWENAIKLIDSYHGPLKKMRESLREEVLSKRLNYLQSQLVLKEPSIKAEKLTANPEKIIEVKDSVNLGFLAQKIYSAKIKEALLLLPIIEHAEKKDLHLIKGILESASVERINNLIVENYQKEIGKTIEVKIDGALIKGQLTEVIEKELSIKMNVVFLKRQLERVYKFSQIDSLDNAKRIVNNDPNESILLQFIYLIRERQFKAAQKTLIKYDGVLKKELKQAMEKFKDEEASFAWNKLLLQLNIDPSVAHNTFIYELNKLKISEDDSWVFLYQLNEFKKRFSTTQYYQYKKALISLLSDTFTKKVSLIKNPDMIVSATVKPGTVSLDIALREIKDGGTIRILPGIYKGTYSVNRKIRLIGSTGVLLKGTVALISNRSEIRNIVVEEGFLDIYREVRDIKIYNCEIRQRSIIMRGDNTNVTIENCIMYGLRVGGNRQTIIKNSVILESPGSPNLSSIQGFVSGIISNTIIRSNSNYAIMIEEKLDNTLVLRHCMIFGIKGICYIRKDKESIQNENDFDRKVGRATEIKLIQPQFIDESNNIFRLKDFSPGFFEGENGKSIGVQYQYNKAAK